ncbi:Flp family type IVb pilin [Nocardioides ferulae]|uniref:Flp family type IVb pilin n=1 Tax=Nocardioides ferulae TaxID=2340821 RepID=UPI000EB432A6|nr:Flp family type IVb pilin [Nocardioides ferulae]
MIQYLRILLAPYLPDRDDERGASAVEYGLLVAGVAAVIVVAVFLLGDYVGGAFDDTNTKLEQGGVVERP